MKKILMVLLALFILNMGCKKMTDSQPLCACSPVTTPYLSLVIKDSNGVDLLDISKPGAFDQEKGQIQMYLKNADGTTKQISFVIRPPFSYGSDQFKYFQLLSPEVFNLSKTNGETFYLKLGTNTEYKLDVKFNNYKLDKLLANNAELPLEQPGSGFDYVSTIFTLKL